MASKKKGKKKKGASKAVIVLVIVAIAFFLSGGVLAYGYSQELRAIEEMRKVVQVDTFYNGISVGGIDVSGMTYEQAYALVQAQEAEKITSFTATISVEGREWKENLKTTSNVQEMFERAYQFARSGDLEARYTEIMTLKENPRDYPIEYAVDTSRLTALVNSIGDELDVEAVAATVTGFDWETKTFGFTDESIGRKLDRDALIRSIESAVENDVYPIAVTGTILTIEPDATRAELSESNKLLASFTTTAAKDKDRNSNITLCSEAFNQSIVMPGETFSLNDKTGLRSKEKGYMAAGAIVNGKLVPEFGGGVCQVSSTLFNAVVRAGLEIVERNNHSYPISYVNRGEDAMIDYPSKDFKFLNNTPRPLYLVTHFVDQKLTVEVYGESILEDGITLNLRSDTTQEIDPPVTEYVPDYNLPVGVEEEERQARKGYRVTTYLQYMRGETLVDEKELHKSYYMPYSKIVRQGAAVYTPVIDNAIPVL